MKWTTKVEIFDEGPNEANGMIGFDTLVKRLEKHFALIASRQAQPRRPGASRRLARRCGNISGVGIREEARLTIRSR